VVERPLRIVITGAAHGVGRLCALSLGDWQPELILCDHDGPGLSAVSNSLRCRGRFCDVASEASVEIFAADLLDRFDSVDVLIHCAGSGCIRALGMWRVARALLPALRRAPGEALIVNVAAPPSKPSVGHDFPYASSADAFAGLNAALVNATRGSNIRVESVPALDHESQPARPLHPSFCVSEVRALVTETFGLPPLSAAELGTSASASRRCAGR